MLLRCIAEVMLPAIAGVDVCESRHSAVACDFGDDRRRGDRGAQRVATDDGLRRADQVRRPVAVDQGEVGATAKPARQRHRGSLHGEQRRAKDVEIVDLGDAGGADANGGAAPKLGENGRAPRRAQALGIIDALGDGSGGKDDRGGDDGSGKRPTARLVNTRDDAAGVPLIGKIGFCRQALAAGPGCAVFQAADRLRPWPASGAQ